MKKNNKGLQYRLEKERYLWIWYLCLATFIPVCFLIFQISIEEKRFVRESYIYIVFALVCVFYLLYANYSRIKRKILSRYGVKHKAEIVKAKYDSPGRWGVSSYYLEIDFINSKGKEKTLYTPGYHGNPNNYLKSADCSVYEWKGFYVEDDFQMRDEMEYFGYGPIPTEKKEFIWR